MALVIPPIPTLACDQSNLHEKQKAGFHAYTCTWICSTAEILQSNQIAAFKWLLRNPNRALALVRALSQLLNVFWIVVLNNFSQLLCHGSSQALLERWLQWLPEQWLQRNEA